MNEPPPAAPSAEMPLTPPISLAAHVGRTLGAGLALMAVTFGFWCTIQFIVAAQVKDQDRAEMIGLSAIVLAPVGAVVAGVVGLVVGAVSRKGKLRWNLLWAQLTFLAIGGVMITWMVLDSNPR